MQAKFPTGPIAAGEVTEWFRANPERLEGTGLTVDDVSTGHIVPESIGGRNYIFNYYIMPKYQESYFRDDWTEEKRAYIGEEAANIALGFAQWFRDKARFILAYPGPESGA